MKFDPSQHHQDPVARKVGGIFAVILLGWLAVVVTLLALWSVKELSELVFQ